MARRYQIDELLWLRSSPLVTKPANLPPVEEWMGPIPDPTTQRKNTNSREPNSQNKTTPRRSSIFEARHISRGSNSEDIVLGPPKTAFASASRISNKSSIDSTERPPRQFDSDEPKTDRFNLREKFFKERDAGDREFDRRDSKVGTFNGRRGEREDWNSGRPRRTFGHEEQDRKPRRNGEFDRWDGARDFNRDRDQRDPNFDRGVKDAKDGRFFPRRDGQPGRARHEASWFRDENAQDGQDAEEEKTPVRNREWRRDRHGADRDWTRGTKLEQEPEWLDSNDKDESRRVHTQEDFERWKERMKAGTSQAPVEEKKEAPVKQTASISEKVEKEAPAPPGKSAKSSRFAGLFSPPPGSPAKESDFQLGTKSPPTSTTPSTATPAVDADQEGFQRILQMLGTSKSRNATPHNDPAQVNHPSLVQTEQTRSEISSPSREQPKRPEQMAIPDASVRGAGPTLKENVYAPDHQARDREHLLRLMQQVRVTPITNQGQASQGQPQSAGPAPGLMNMPEGIPHPPPGLPSAQKLPAFIDDPAIANLQRSEADQLRRRPANGPPQWVTSRICRFKRPPGFEHMPPPGWNGPQIPPQQAGGGPANPMGPPPGIPTPTRGMNPNFMGNLTPMHGNMPPLGERQPFPRGAGAAGPGGFPPGMMPPPGYMNGPPPSGFPPMPHNGDVLMGVGHAGQGPFEGNPGPQGPPPSSRHLLDMFGQVGGDARGGMIFKMMDRIDFELCIDVDQYAATSLQHNINPTKVDDYDYEASSTVPRIRTRHHDEVDSANNTSEDDDSHPPRKRTRFLGADDRREVSLDEAYNETENASEYQDLIHGHNQAMGSGTSHENQSSHSSHDIVNSYPDIDMAMETDQNNDEPTQRLGLTSLQHEGPGPSPIRSTITTGGFSTGSSHPSNRFTIYEDPDYMDIDGSNPETSWCSYSTCEDDDKENVDEELDSTFPGRIGAGNDSELNETYNQQQTRPSWGQEPRPSPPPPPTSLHHEETGMGGESDDGDVVFERHHRSAISQDAEALREVSHVALDSINESDSSIQYLPRISSRLDIPDRTIQGRRPVRRVRAFNFEM
ncbi:uncharacterized protein ATNIH1004_003105 [Aspergillus tanneri]|uniref:Uncharacterized protein n=1 Tax=Aspergillus tanneri TaxID=1220188 RepID=A0A5M9N0E5_9EURO|nr:uncharacterized protein ATNIH1004_003105 [Aspergillus tanneri]KAA8650419.1 hypothetical protein ATNIH1004_003105 [Aspergillus tanneri]